MQTVLFLQMRVHSFGLFCHSPRLLYYYTLTHTLTLFSLRIKIMKKNIFTEYSKSKETAAIFFVVFLMHPFICTMGRNKNLLIYNLKNKIFNYEGFGQLEVCYFK